MKFIRDHSSLSPLLKNFPEPFGVSNGIPKEKKRKDLERLCDNDHQKAKRELLKKYFDIEFDGPDADQQYDNIIIYGFVGRITKQKGVLNLLETVEAFIHHHQMRPIMFIAGPTAPGDPYGDACAGKMHYLRSKYPKNFWADPGLLFGDGPLLNCASDWGIVPSDFEPGGIVQNEYLVASTPVIATETGGLKDTINHFDRDTREGNGLLCYPNNYDSLMWALNESVGIYNSKELYLELRNNCYPSCVAINDVGEAYQKEFYRVCDKAFYNKSLVDADPRDHRKRQGGPQNNKNTFKFWIVTGPEAEQVFLRSSFDGWRSLFSVNRDTQKNEWSFYREIEVGKSYEFYFIINGRKKLNWSESLKINSNGELCNEARLITE